VKKVELRNFLGGFLGGAFGILGFGYFGSRRYTALLIACFIGCVIGWYYIEILQALSAMIHREGEAVREPRTESEQIRTRALMACLGAILLFVAIHSPAVLYALPWIKYGFREHIAWSIVSLIACAVAIIGPCFPVSYQCADETSPFHKLEEMRPKKIGLARYFWVMVANLFYWEVLVSIGTVLVGITILLFVIWMILFVLLSFKIAFAKVLYFASTKTGHLPCFFSTAIVTAICAWRIQPSAEHPLLLWLAALFAGLISGVVTKAVFWIGNLLANKESIQYIVDHDFDHQAQRFTDHYFDRIGTMWIGVFDPLLDKL
jgi:hypothetical protein